MELDFPMGIFCHAVLQVYTCSASFECTHAGSLYFSAQSGKSLIPDPGVNAGFLSVPFRNLNLAGPEIFLPFHSSNSVY